MPRLIPSMITAPISPLRLPPLAPKIPIPLAKPIIPQFRRGRKKAQLFKPSSIYQPSLTASVFKIRGKPRKLKIGGYNPFRIRGLPKMKRPKLRLTNRRRRRSLI